ncbi:hypothetical protein CALCODRAFT_511523 [Calocera cornea HHB12733]|uniref:Uncharacterized protein n=1 Tax=Calocera cornea HHB12733 TaxID=1353952 RepID=A0A165DQP1_9BASI|nr:hypothetical protein CALCODRAFT_511523 [Calocera cornea HHB12733]
MSMHMTIAFDFGGYTRTIPLDIDIDLADHGISLIGSGPAGLTQDDGEETADTESDGMSLTAPTEASMDADDDSIASQTDRDGDYSIDTASQQGSELSSVILADVPFIDNSTVYSTDDSQESSAATDSEDDNDPVTPSVQTMSKVTTRNAFMRHLPPDLPRDFPSLTDGTRNALLQAELPLSSFIPSAGNRADKQTLTRSTSTDGAQPSTGLAPILPLITAESDQVWPNESRLSSGYEGVVLQALSANHIVINDEVVRSDARAQKLIRHCLALAHSTLITDDKRGVIAIYGWSFALEHLIDVVRTLGKRGVLERKTFCIVFEVLSACAELTSLRFRDIVKDTLTAAASASDEKPEPYA